MPRAGSNTPDHPQPLRETPLAQWLDQPISATYCVGGWIAATVLYIALVALFGGPSQLDAYETVFSTWSIAHGQFACAFPHGFKTIAPLYPLFSGAVAAIGHVGGSVPFPSGAVAQGTHCDKAFLAVNAWSLRTNAIGHTVAISYTGWLALLGGATAFLRTTARGRSRWEPATLMLLACLPTVWMCIQSTLHPEDLFAMGFSLAAMACARREMWVGVGVLVAVAVLSQQFALLVAVPLLIFAAPRQRFRAIASAVVTVAVITVPLIVLSSGSAAGAILLGTGDTGGIGGALVWELNLHGALLVSVSRVLPILLSGLLAWWAVKEIGQDSLEPVPLLSLVAVSLGLRLVFEQQLFGYYYMALSVSLVMLDMISMRIRDTLLAWLALVSVVYMVGRTNFLEPPIGKYAAYFIPLGATVLAVAKIVLEIRRPGTRPTLLLLWSVLIVGTLVAWTKTAVLGQPPTWFWQVVLVPSGIALAAGPLILYVRHRPGDSTEASVTGNEDRIAFPGSA